MLVEGFLFDSRLGATFQSYLTDMVGLDMFIQRSGCSYLVCTNHAKVLRMLEYHLSHL